jgi:hypothetical protein
MVLTPIRASSIGEALMKILASFVIASVVGLAAQPAGAQAAAARALSIVAPVDRQTVPDNDGEVDISFAPSPPLADGELIVLRVDDQIMVLPSGSTKFALTGVPVGTHVIEAVIVDAEASPVAAADAVTFEVGVWLRI